jgi:DNA-binding MarR family transcriptional regulator
MKTMADCRGHQDETICQPSEPAVAAFLGMARFVQQTERAISARLNCHRLNAGQLDVLLHAAAAEGLTQQDLAVKLCHSKANISQLLDKMEAAGMVRREPEGRAYGIYLTEAGREALGAAIPEVDRLIGGQFGSLAPAEQAELFRLIDKLEAPPG